MLSVQCEYCHSRIFANDRRCYVCGAPPPPEQAKIKSKPYRGDWTSTAIYPINVLSTSQDYNIVMGTTDTLESS